MLNMQVAPVGELSWNPRAPEQGVLWGSWIDLGDKFFQAITAFPVPGGHARVQGSQKPHSSHR